jgi:hypothetical protein
MTEKERPELDDFSANGEFKELKLNPEKRRFCIAQARELFTDDEVMTLRFALGLGWSEKLPELAQKFSTLKSSSLDLILIVGPNLITDDVAASSNRAWLNGLTKSVDKNDLENDDGEDADGEEPEPVSFVDIKLFFGQDCSITEVDEEAPDITISLFREEDKQFEIFSLVEEKSGVLVERRSAKRKGEAQRLLITSEILGLAKKMFIG